MIVWSENAQEDLLEIYNYVFINSPQNAEMMVNTFINFAETFSFMPYKYPKEAFANDEKIRMAFKWSYKIIYLIDDECIRILNIINCKQDIELDFT